MKEDEELNTNLYTGGKENVGRATKQSVSDDCDDASRPKGTRSESRDTLYTPSLLRCRGTEGRRP